MTTRANYYGSGVPWDVYNYFPCDADPQRVALTRKVLEPIFVFLTRGYFFGVLVNTVLL